MTDWQRAADMFSRRAAYRLTTNQRLRRWALRGWEENVKAHRRIRELEAELRRIGGA